MRSNWLATCLACFSLPLLITMKCGLRTSSQFSAFSCAGATAATKRISSKKMRLDIRRAHYRYTERLGESNRTNLGLTAPPGSPCQHVLKWPLPLLALIDEIRRL